MKAAFVSLLFAVLFNFPGAMSFAQAPELKNKALPPDIADVPYQDLRAGGDARKRYFLIGGGPQITPPPDGYRLLLVLPGGDGSADFQNFVMRIYKNALTEQYLVAELVSISWSANQFNQLVWPTDTNTWPNMGFSTEAFAISVINDVKQRYKIDERFIFTLGWSSGGPPCYAFSLKLNTPVRGTFVAMSVFRTADLPPLARAQGQSYYLLHSPQDFIPISMAENARNQLTAIGATVKLETYPGGHGWQGDVYGMQREGIDWLEKQAGEEENTAVRPENWDLKENEEKK